MTREQTPITVLNGLDFREKCMVITKAADGGFGLQVLVSGTETVMIALCPSADKLGRWALDGGAKEVRHDYDLTSKAAMRFTLPKSHNPEANGEGIE